MMWSSWHNHTGDDPRFSYCATDDLTPEVYRRQLRLGPWEAFALTEHAFALAIPPDEQPWPHQWYHQPSRLESYHDFREDKTLRFLERIGRVCDGERLFSGLEVEVACDGSLSMDPMLWPYLHVVIGSVHYLPPEPKQLFDNHFAQLDMLMTYPIDILGHPLRALASSGPVPHEIIDEIVRRARAADVAIEINAHMPCDHDPYLLARAAREGLRIAFGLDAHCRDELALHTYFAQVITDSGVDPNTLMLFHPDRKTAKPRSLVR